MFFSSNGKNLPAEKNAIIREKLEAVDDKRYGTISSIELKDTTMLLPVARQIKDSKAKTEKKSVIFYKIVSYFSSVTSLFPNALGPSSC